MDLPSAAERPCVIGVEFDGPVEIGQGLVEAPGQSVSLPALRDGPSVFEVEFYGAVEVGQRLIEITGQPMDEPALRYPDGARVELHSSIEVG